jgi:uncharacterized protein (DUF4415 family)
VSSMKDLIKNKVKSSQHSAHNILIDPVEETTQNTNVDVNENVDVNVNKKERKRKKFEDNFTRQTYYIQNDLLEKLNEVAGSEKGEKTRIINEALRKYLKKV